MSLITKTLELSSVFIKYAFVISISNILYYKFKAKLSKGNT